MLIKEGSRKHVRLWQPETTVLLMNFNFQLGIDKQYEYGVRILISIFSHAQIYAPAHSLSPCKVNDMAHFGLPEKRQGTEE